MFSRRARAKTQTIRLYSLTVWGVSRNHCVQMSNVMQSYEFELSDWITVRPQEKMDSVHSRTYDQITENTHESWV